MEPPSIAVVIPAYEAGRTIERALSSLNAQRYAGQIEVVVVDGGSSDGTVEIARRQGARVLTNSDRRQEEACGVGIERTESELVLVLDADDELPHEGWVERMVAALGLADDVVAADALFHTWRREDPAINRLAALMGGTDPLAIDLGWSDRWGYHHDRWTGMPVEEEHTSEALIVRIDPDHAPPMGSNGFLVRRAALEDVPHSPFWHPEVVAALARRGWRFARVRDSVIHHFAPDTRSAVRKIRARTAKTAHRLNRRQVAPPMGPLQILRLGLWSVTVLGPCYRALRGYLRHPDPAWALYPPWHLAWTGFYVVALLRRALGLDRR